MTPRLDWIRLELAIPRQGHDVRMLVNGRRVSAEEFHQALSDVDRQVFALAVADELDGASP
jgi:hypothetical protein